MKSIFIGLLLFITAIASAASLAPFDCEITLRGAVSSYEVSADEGERLVKIDDERRLGLSWVWDGNLLVYIWDAHDRDTLRVKWDWLAGSFKILSNNEGATVTLAGQKLSIQVPGRSLQVVSVKRRQ